MNYHDRIMNLPPAPGRSPRSAYQDGHRDARHAAAEIATEADAYVELIGVLVKACRRALHLVEDEDNNKIIVEMPGSFGLLLDLQNALANAKEKGFE